MGEFGRNICQVFRTGSAIGWFTGQSIW